MFSSPSSVLYAIVLITGTGVWLGIIGIALAALFSYLRAWLRARREHARVQKQVADRLQAYASPHRDYEAWSEFAKHPRVLGRIVLPVEQSARYKADLAQAADRAALEALAGTPAARADQEKALGMPGVGGPEEAA